MRRLLNRMAGAYLALARRERRRRRCDWTDLPLLFKSMRPLQSLMTKASEFSRPRCLPVRCNLVSTAIQFPGLSFPCNGWREKKLTKRSAAPFGFVCSMA